MSQKSNFRLAEIFGGVIGLTAPAAIMMTGIAGYFNNISFGIAAIAASATAAYSFGRFGKEFLIGVTNEVGPARIKDKNELQKSLNTAKDKSGKVQLHATLMEAGLHTGMYFTAMAATQASPLWATAAFISYGAFAVHAKLAIDNMRDASKPFRNAVADVDNETYLSGRNIGRAAGLCSVSAITLAILGVHLESWPLLVASALPSVVGSGLVSQVGRFGAQNATQYAPPAQKEELEKKINIRGSAIAAGLAELSVHSTMFCSGAAILSDNPLYWGAAAASLLSCGYFAKETIRTQGAAVEAVVKNSFGTTDNLNDHQEPIVKQPASHMLPARTMEI